MDKKLALITGATSGIGKAFAKKFAQENYDLILTGRREAELLACAANLKELYGINVTTILSDFYNVADLDALVSDVKKLKNLDALVNNAGFARKGGHFYADDLESNEKMVIVHSLAVMRLTHAALANMVEHGSGILINVSSKRAYYPYAGEVMYSASKAFVSLFTESLALEVAGSGVYVQSLCPGLTITDLHSKIGLDVSKRKFKWWMQPPMTADQVVAESFQALRENKVLCIPGLRNRWFVMVKTLRRFF